MGSVFAQLLDTLPIHLAVKKVEQDSGHAFLRATQTQVNRCLRILDGGSPHRQVPYGSMQDIQEKKLWSWTHGATPNVVTDVTCCARDYEYQAFKVADRIEWGFKSGSNVEPKVRIETSTGDEVDLPLNAASLHSRWLVAQGASGASSHWLWPLEANLDSGLVLAFAYELSPVGDGLVAVPYTRDRDPVSDAAIRGLNSGGANAGWVRDALEGDFMPTRTRRHAPSGEVGSTVAVRASASRVLVVMSFAVMCERADFEPGEIAGMAKIFPQLMVKANTPLSKVRGAVRICRPAASTLAGERRGSQGHTSCHGESEERIGPLLVTDTNTRSFLGVPPPFFSDLFAYYQDDFEDVAARRLHVIRRDRPARRRGIFGTNRVTGTGGALDAEPNVVLKERRQGEFDSIHLAPSLRLDADHYTPTPGGAPVAAVRGAGAVPVLGPLLAVPTFVGLFPVESRESWHLDRIKMAPFCSHDCFHWHWRWGTNLGGGHRFVRGWSADGPYAVDGAPMAPLNQDVWLTLSSPNVAIYEVEATAPEGAASIPAFAWQVIHHHGAGFVSAIADPVKFGGARTAVSLERAVVLFNGRTSGRNPVDSSAAFYWHLRHTYDEGPVERLTLTPQQRRAAREL